MRRGVKRNRQADRLLGIPLLQTLALVHRRRPVPQEPPRRIGFMSSSALGDTLLASGPLGDLRAAYPGAAIIHICMPGNLAAAEIIPGASRRLVVELTRPLEAVRQIRALGLDVMVDLTSWQRLTALLTLLSGARYTVGFDSPGQYRAAGYDRAILHRRDVHEIENFRALLRGSGLFLDGIAQHEPALTLPPGCGAEPFVGEGEILALHAWASGQRSHLREWPDGRWVELAQRLSGIGTLSGTPLFVVTGAPSDATRTAGLVARLREGGLRAEPFVSPDGFCSLTRLLRRCRLVASVNTGVMHLAAIAGAPTVAINGPNAGFRWGPRGPRVRNVQAADGSGGYLHLGFEHGRHPAPAMERTGVDQVFAACVDLLAAADREANEASASRPDAVEVAG